MSFMSPEEMQEQTMAPEDYDSFFEMEATRASQDIIQEAATEMARHEAYMEKVSMRQIAEGEVKDPNPTQGDNKPIPKAQKMPKSNGYK